MSAKGMTLSRHILGWQQRYPHAGGCASTGTQRILDIQAESIHQRLPLVIGGADDVALYEKFLADGRP